MTGSKILSNKCLLSLAIATSFGAMSLTMSQPAKAVSIGSVTSTHVRQYWNIDGNSSFIKEWYTSREISVVHGYAFTGYTALAPYYHGLVVDKGVYYNYRTW